MKDVKTTLSPTSTRGTSIAELVTMMAIIGVSITIALRSGAIFYRTAQASADAIAFRSIAPVSIDIGHAPSEGVSSAGIGIIVFSDFQCPFCRAFSADVLPYLRRQYIDTGSVRFVFKQFPLAGLHPDARRLAELSSCLANQGIFWKAHDFLFQRSTGFDTLTADGLATSIGGDAIALRACVSTSAGRAVIDADVQQGRALGVHGTPTFFLGDLQGDSLRAVRRLEGVSPLTAFKSALASAERVRK